jgi:hypothetical protein
MRLLTRLNDSFRNLRYGVANWLAYASLIYQDRDWDWTYLLRLLELKLRRMAQHEDEHSYHTTAAFDAANQRKAAAVIRRLTEQGFDYHDNARRSPFNSDPADRYVAVDRSQKQDLEYLTGLLRKHLRSWWS